MPPTPQLVGPDGRFPEEVVEAVVQHMNDDHAEDTALIARAFSGLPQVDAAEVTDVDTSGMQVAVQAAGRTQPARIAFAAPVTDRSGLREEITRLYHAARDELGADEQQPA